MSRAAVRQKKTTAEARTVLQNVRLLAVGGSTSPDPPPAASNAPSSGATHVTVAVTPSAGTGAGAGRRARAICICALRAIGDGSETPIPSLPAPPLPKTCLAVSRRGFCARSPALRAVETPKIMPLPPLPVVLPRPAAALPAVRLGRHHQRHRQPDSDGGPMKTFLLFALACFSAACTFRSRAQEIQKTLRRRAVRCVPVFDRMTTAAVGSPAVRRHRAAVVAAAARECQKLSARPRCLSATMRRNASFAACR